MIFLSLLSNQNLALHHLCTSVCYPVFFLSVCTSVWPQWSPMTMSPQWSALNSAWLFKWIPRTEMLLFAGKESKANITITKLAVFIRWSLQCRFWRSLLHWCGLGRVENSPLLSTRATVWWHLNSCSLRHYLLSWWGGEGCNPDPLCGPDWCSSLKAPSWISIWILFGVNKTWHPNIDGKGEGACLSFKSHIWLMEKLGKHKEMFLINTQSWKETFFFILS